MDISKIRFDEEEYDIKDEKARAYTDKEVVGYKDQNEVNLDELKIGQIYALKADDHIALFIKDAEGHSTPLTMIHARSSDTDSDGNNFINTYATKNEVINASEERVRKTALYPQNWVAYLRDNQGNDTALPLYDTAPLNILSIPFRGFDGTFEVAEPTKDSNPATKHYVDSVALNGIDLSSYADKEYVDSKIGNFVYTDSGEKIVRINGLDVHDGNGAEYGIIFTNENEGEGYVYLDQNGEMHLEDKTNDVTVSELKQAVDYKGSKVFAIGSAQETVDGMVFPKIALSQAKEIYNAYVDGYPCIIRWMVMNSIPVDASVIGSDYVSDKSFSVLIHNTYIAKYSFTDSSTDAYATMTVTDLAGGGDSSSGGGMKLYAHNIRSKGWTGMYDACFTVINTCEKSLAGTTPGRIFGSSRIYTTDLVDEGFTIEDHRKMIALQVFNHTYETDTSKYFCFPAWFSNVTSEELPSGLNTNSFLRINGVRKDNGAVVSYIIFLNGKIISDTVTEL